MIDKARENGIIVNVFWSDDAGETRKFLDMGIDCILTNDYNLNKVAGVAGVPVLNVNDLAGALRPAVLPGERSHQ